MQISLIIYFVILIFSLWISSYSFENYLRIYFRSNIFRTPPGQSFFFLFYFLILYKNIFYILYSDYTFPPHKYSKILLLVPPTQIEINSVSILKKKQTSIDRKMIK